MSLGIAHHDQTSDNPINKSNPEKNGTDHK